MSAALVSIIGPPAAGKTTLAELLCGDLPAELIREDYRGNPFLERSYAGDASARLPGQLCFLASRLRQLAATAWPEEGAFVSDYGYCQDRIYARVCLAAEEFKLYERLERSVARAVHPPEVLVHLDADAATLLRRIAQRGRVFERAMDREFLDTMRAQYAKAAAESLCPVIELDCETADFRLPEVRADLVGRIRAGLGHSASGGG